jgi:hypothetical protein
MLGGVLGGWLGSLVDLGLSDKEIGQAMKVFKRAIAVSQPSFQPLIEHAVDESVRMIPPLCRAVKAAARGD